MGVCQNPDCNSYGEDHPNCQCYAEGGTVVCMQKGGMAHNPSCMYFKGGAAVKGKALGDYKKLKEDSKTITLAHPMGHKITMLKSRLNSQQLLALKKMPRHMADGGDTEDEGGSGEGAGVGASSQDDATTKEQLNPFIPTSASQLEDVGKNIGQAASTVGSGIKAVGSGIGNMMYGSASLAYPPQNTSQDIQKAGEFSYAPEASNQQGQSPLNLPQDPRGTFEQQAFNLGNKALGEEKDYAIKLADARQQEIENHILARQNLEQDVQNASQTFQQHQAELMKDYAAEHINPNHYQENMSTGSKVATAIGLILGGFSKNGVNPASEWLKGQIDRDIQSQRENLDKKKTLLGANESLYHDSVIASNQARINLNDIYANQMELAAQKLGTPQALAAYDLHKAQWVKENAQLLDESANRAAVLKAIRQNGGQGVDPLTLARAKLIPPEQAMKEQESVDRQRSAVANLNRLYAEATKYSKPGSLLSYDDRQRLAALNAEIGDTMLSTDVNHRVSPETKATFLEPFLVGTKKNIAGSIPYIQQEALNKVKEFSAGTTPYTEKIAPGAIPQYAIPQRQYKVGDIVYVDGKRGQVGADGKIRKVN